MLSTDLANWYEEGLQKLSTDALSLEELVAKPLEGLVVAETLTLNWQGQLLLLAGPHTVAYVQRLRDERRRHILVGRDQIVQGLLEQSADANLRRQELWDLSKALTNLIKLRSVTEPVRPSEPAYLRALLPRVEQFLIGVAASIVADIARDRMQQSPLPATPLRSEDYLPSASSQDTSTEHRVGPVARGDDPSDSSGGSGSIEPGAEFIQSARSESYYAIAPPAWQAKLPRPTPAAPARRLLYAADWLRRRDEWWSSALEGQKSRWKFSRGTLCNDGRSHYDFIQNRNQVGADTYAVEAEIQVMSANCADAAFGILVLSRFYHGDWHSETAGLLREGSSWHAKISSDSSPSEPFDPGRKWHTYRVEVKANTIKLFIDGVFYFQKGAFEGFPMNKEGYPTGVDSFRRTVGLHSTGAEGMVRSYKILEL